MSPMIATFPGIGTTTAISTIEREYNIKAVDVAPPYMGYGSDPIKTYADEIVAIKQNAKLVFFRPSIALLERLMDQGHKVTLVLPNKGNLEAHINAQRDRGVDSATIDQLEATLKKEIEAFEAFTYPRPLFNIVVLPEGKGLDKLISFFVK